MRPIPPAVRRARGVTLVELMIAMTIMAVVALLATRTFVAFGRTDSVRRKVADVQGGSRLALLILEREMRHASLGSGTGRIWTSSGGNRVARPTVQIFTGVQGTGTIDLSGFSQFGQPKPGTDALLLVGAVAGVRAATRGEITGATAGMPRTFPVTQLSSLSGGTTYTFTAGDALLLGDYLDASWAVVASTNAGPQITAVDDVRLPGDQVPRLAAGSIVRRARSRLYYVDARDQLVRLELLVPHSPTALSEIAGGEVLASGVENLQFGCEVGDGTGLLTACGGALPATDPIQTESATFFGPFDAGDGPLLADAAALRTIVLDVAARSVKALAEQAGDDAISLNGVTLSPGEGADANGAYARRGYELTAAVRNTSLGAF